MKFTRVTANGLVRSLWFRSCLDDYGNALQGRMAVPPSARIEFVRCLSASGLSSTTALMKDLLSSLIARVRRDYLGSHLPAYAAGGNLGGGASSTRNRAAAGSARARESGIVANDR